MSAAIRLEEPDHVPLWCLWSHARDPYNRKDDRKRVEALLDLGLDDTLWLYGPWRIHPDVKVTSWAEPVPDEEYDLIHKRFETPAGTLEHILRTSEHFTSADDIPVMGDFNMSHGIRSLIRGREDLPALRYLLSDPDPQQLADYREQAKAYRQFVQDKQVLLEGAFVPLGDAAAWLVQPQDLIYACHDDPGFVEELLDIIQQWNLKQVGYLLDEKVDILLHRGWYEFPDFWGLDGYRKFLKPLLKKEIDLVHQADVWFSYIMTKGIMPLLDDFLELGIDLLWGVDPVQGEADLEAVARKVSGRMAVLGGFNGNLTVSEGPIADIERDVETAIRTLGPGGGYIAAPVDKIEEWTPWENVEAMIDKWKELASYPIRV